MKKLMTITLGLSLFSGSAIFAADRHPAPRGRGDARHADGRDAGRRGSDHRAADHRDAGRRDGRGAKR